MSEPDSTHVEPATLFDFLPIGAYRSRPDGTQLRANPALVRLNGYDDEPQMLAAVRDIGREWYVEPQRREQFLALMARDGCVRSFDSQVRRHRTRELIWVSENAHVVRDAAGGVLYYEGTVEEITARVAEQHVLAASEARLRSVTAHVPGIVFQVAVDARNRRRYLFVSEGVRALCGVSPEAVLADSRRLDGLMAPGERERVDAERALADAAGHALVCEYSVQRSDGTPLWLQVTSAPMSRDAGGMVRSGVMIDVTARRAAEAALRESDERWKLALEATGDCVWDCDLVGGRSVLSRRFTEMYGHDCDQGHDGIASLDSLTHPDDLEEMRRDRQAHIDGRLPVYANEHRIRCRDGSWKWVLTRGLVIQRDARGRALRMLGTHTDITARKQAEALRVERDRAAAADQAKTEMLSRISHELRTPLNAILGFAQLMAGDGATAPHQLPWVRQMLASGHHLLGLVEDVLDLSSAQSRQFKLELVDVDVDEVMAESWMMLAVDAGRQRIALVDGRAGAPPLAARADRRRLRQVLSNLLSNAIKYNRPGGRIVFDGRPDGAQVRLRICDTGHGMDAAQIERVFMPFERLGAQAGTIAGSGLGLAVTRQLLEAMGGSVEVQSTPGSGSIFTVLLPAAAGAPPAPARHPAADD